MMHKNEKTLEQKLHKNREQVINFCSAFQCIYVYGTGVVAKKIFQYLQEENIVVKAFVVSDGRKTMDVFCGSGVMEVSSIDKSSSCGIMLGVGKEHQDEILLELEKVGLQKKNIFVQNIYNMNTLQDTKIDESVILEKENISGSFFEGYLDLDGIGKINHTDKCSDDHNYLKKYEFFFNKFRNQEINVLELGVLRGSSIRTLSQYFTNAKVIGVDIDVECTKYANDNIEIQIRDLSKTEEINQLLKINPSVIIDDASHIWSHQINALNILYPSLKSGGIYIMEDLETSFPSYASMNYDESCISGYDFCEMIAEVVTSKERLRAGRTKEMLQFQEEIERIAVQVDMIAFIKGSCIMVKK